MLFLSRPKRKRCPSAHQCRHDPRGSQTTNCCSLRRQATSPVSSRLSEQSLPFLPQRLRAYRGVTTPLSESARRRGGGLPTIPAYPFTTQRRRTGSPRTPLATGHQQKTTTSVSPNSHHSPRACLWPREGGRSQIRGSAGDYPTSDAQWTLCPPWAHHGNSLWALQSRHTMGILRLCWGHLPTSRHPGAQRTRVPLLGKPWPKAIKALHGHLSPVGDSPTSTLLGIQLGLDSECWGLSNPRTRSQTLLHLSTPPTHMRPLAPRHHSVPFFMMWTFAQALSAHNTNLHGLQHALSISALTSSRCNSLSSQKPPYCELVLRVKWRRMTIVRLFAESSPEENARPARLTSTTYR